ncbi:MAG TPA: hypothetical protein VF669_09305 [Tepidisphaeraceae bacterium]|jgi:hypothetical protein
MWRRLLIILVVGAAILLLAETLGPGGVQRRGMKAAESFRQSIAPSLAADPRFARVETSVMTHPSLRVYGEVPDETALSDLQRLVQAPADAPFRVILHAKVRDIPVTRPGD